MKIVRGKELKYDKKETLNEMFWKTVGDYPNVRALSFFEGGELRSLTYREFGEVVEKLAKGLMKLGVKKVTELQYIAIPDTNGNSLTLQYLQLEQ